MGSSKCFGATQLHDAQLMMANMICLAWPLQSIISGFVEKDSRVMPRDAERENLWLSTDLWQEKVGRTLGIWEYLA